MQDFDQWNDWFKQLVLEGRSDRTKSASIELLQASGNDKFATLDLKDVGTISLEPVVGSSITKLRGEAVRQFAECELQPAPIGLVPPCGPASYGGSNCGVVALCRSGGYGLSCRSLAGRTTTVEWVERA